MIFADKLPLGQAAVYSIMGILFVILVLILLVLILLVIGAVKTFISKKIAERKKSRESDAEAPTPIISESGEDETVAAIIAALTAFYETENKTEKTTAKAPFIIKNIKRIK